MQLQKLNALLFLQIPASLKAKDNLESNFTLVSVEDCLPGTDDEVYRKLLLDLAQQAKVCR